MAEILSFVELQEFHAYGERCLSVGPCSHIMNTMQLAMCLVANIIAADFKF